MEKMQEPFWEFPIISNEASAIEELVVDSGLMQKVEYIDHNELDELDSTPFSPYETAITSMEDNSTSTAATTDLFLHAPLTLANIHSLDFSHSPAHL
jgi:hypothetical protein